MLQRLELVDYSETQVEVVTEPAETQVFAGQNLALLLTNEVLAVGRDQVTSIFAGDSLAPALEKLEEFWAGRGLASSPTTPRRCSALPWTGKWRSRPRFTAVSWRPIC